VSDYRLVVHTHLKKGICGRSMQIPFFLFSPSNNKGRA
jgi:hypothetical protein